MKKKIIYILTICALNLLPTLAGSKVEDASNKEVKPNEDRSVIIDLLRNADRRAGQGDWGKVTTDLLLVQNKRSDDYLLNRKLALAYAAMGRWTHAEKIYQDFMKSDDLGPNQLIDYGKVLVHMNRPARAEPMLTKALLRNPRHLLARFYLAVALIDEARYVEAIERLDVLGLVDIVRLLHEIESHQDTLEHVLKSKGLAILTQMVKEGGMGGRPIDQIIFSATRKKDPKSSVSSKRLRVQLQEVLTILRTGLGMNAMDKKLTWLSQQGIGGLSYQLIKVKVLRQGGDGVGAERLLKSMIGRFPNRELLHAALGEHYLELHQFGEAEKAYRKALDLKPALLTGRVGLSMALAGQGKLDLAIRTLESVMANPKSAHVVMSILRGDDAYRKSIRDHVLYRQYLFRARLQG